MIFIKYISCLIGGGGGDQLQDPIEQNYNKLQTNMVPVEREEVKR